MNIFEFNLSEDVSKLIFVSIISLVVYFAAKYLAHLGISKKRISEAQQIILRKRNDQILGYIIFFTVLFLWFTKFHNSLLSMVAISAALAISLKELIMCLTGGFLNYVSGHFKLNDRIEVDDIRGFVIEKSLLTTKLLEVGPDKYSQQITGNVLSIPNSIFLSKQIKNKSYFKGFSIKTYMFKIKDLKFLNELEFLLQSKAEEICRPYLKEAKETIKKFCSKEGIFLSSLDPRTKIIIDENNTIFVIVKLLVKNDSVADTEQFFNRLYVNWLVEISDT